MRAEQRDGTAQRQVLIGCVTSDELLSRLAGRLGEEPWQSRWSNLVWGWCRSHHGKHHAAPNGTIATYYERWAARNNDRDVSSMVERFLVSLSEESSHTRPPLDYLLDTAQVLVDEVLLAKLREELEEQGDTGKTISLVESFPSRRVLLRPAPAVDVLRDTAVQKSALLDKQRVLVRYPGPAGEFFGDELAEDSFIGVMASSKGGKSYLLMDMAWRATRQGRKVAYFQVGDLSKGQIMRRFTRRAAYRPLDAKKVRMPVSIMLPPATLGSRDPAIVEHEEKTYTKDLTWEAAERAWQRSQGKGELRLSYHPVKTVSVAGIKSVLDGWDRDGYIANCVIVDYAGNLAPVDGKANPIDQVSHSWAMLRQLSEIRKCLVVTANQSNKEGFRAWVLTRSNFAESKMVLAHVTSFIGVNMTDEEKYRGVMRLNFVVRREEQFVESYCLSMASCLDVSNCCVVSCLPQIQ